MTDQLAPPGGEPGQGPRSEVPGGLGAGRALAIALAYLATQVIVGAAWAVAAVAYFVVSHGGRPPRGPEVVVAQIILPATAFSLVCGGLVVFASAALAVRGTAGGLADLGWRAARAREIWVSGLAGVLWALVFLVVQSQIFPPPAGQTWGPLATAADAGGWHRALWAFIALLAPPIEEFLFRGVLWTGLRRSLGAVAAATVVTTVFVASHATEALNYWPAWLAIFGAAVGTLIQRIRTGSLVPPLALHAAYNASLIAAVYVSTP